jgi:hypothetical protein
VAPKVPKLEVVVDTDDGAGQLPIDDPKPNWGLFKLVL